MLEADHETFVTGVEDSVVEKAGSAVGTTAVLGVELDGTALGIKVSDDHSSPDECMSGIPLPGIPVPGIPVPNDIAAVWSGGTFMIEFADCQPPDAGMFPSICISLGG